MADALAAKNSEIEALVSSMDALKKQAAASEGKLASLQVSCTHIIHCTYMHLSIVITFNQFFMNVISYVEKLALLDLLPASVILNL